MAIKTPIVLSLEIKVYVFLWQPDEGTIPFFFQNQLISWSLLMFSILNAILFI